jgi:hypothetical protein
MQSYCSDERKHSKNHCQCSNDAKSDFVLAPGSGKPPEPGMPFDGRRSMFTGEYKKPESEQQRQYPL